MTILNEKDPMKQALLMMAQLEEAEIKKKEATQMHEAKAHDMGFSLAFETPEGIIGLWSCWLGDQLYIGYPRNWDVSDELIKATLQMEDEKLMTRRQWGKFYGKRMDGGGRVWVDHTENHSHGRTFDLIQNGNLKKLHCGHDGSKSVYSIGYTCFTEEELDAPTAKEKHVQPYRDAFMQLALNLAKEHGGVTAVHIAYDFTILTPALLEAEGYKDIYYVEGNPQYVSSFGGTVVHAKKEQEEILLKSGNSLVPWVNIRKVPVTSELTVEKILKELLVF